MDWNRECELAKGYLSEYDRGYQDGIKQTAEKLITKIKQFLNNVETVLDDDKYSLYPEIGYKCSEVDDFLDELAKECSIEIKE